VEIREFSTGNVVSGNYIGTDVTGTLDLGNAGNGVAIGDGAQSNIVGGVTPSERNIISGNDVNGVDIGDSGTSNNVVSGNYIGTDVTGAVNLGNSESGVVIFEGVQSNVIGGTTADERNIISGNDDHGVLIQDPNTENNRVSGNYIGIDASGIAALGNTAVGVRIDSEAKSNTIGGATAGERNIISGNDRAGIEIGGRLLGTGSNTISGNYIGTDVTGTADLGNSWDGIDISGGSKSNTIGGTGFGAGNTIAFNDQAGVVIRGDSTDFNRISRNSIHDNTGLGIDLVDDGNDEIPAPIITSGDLLGNILTVSGTGAGANATAEVFKADSFASGEGMIYLGTLIADGSGNFSGPLDVIGMGISAGDPLVATTIHTNNNTSEFSSPFAITVSYVLIPATIAEGKLMSCGFRLALVALVVTVFVVIFD